MSIESAKTFIERMKTDEEFAQKIMAETNAEARMALARLEGFNFTAEEIGQSTGELSDDDLELVVGGSSSRCQQLSKMLAGVGQQYST